MWNSNPSATSATPISSRKASASIFVVGCSAMKAPTGPAATYITIMAMTMAAIISSICWTSPIAVRIESSENTRSMSTNCTTTRVKLEVARGAGPSLSRCSTSPWISRVALAMRKAPPPIRMMSRQDTPMPNTVNSGAVSPISQVRPASIAIRKMKASESPIWRTRRASFGSQRDVRMEMKTRLSMPSTISSVLRAISASQACGSTSSSIMGTQPVGQPDADEVESDRDKGAAHPRLGIEVPEQGDEAQCGPCEHGRDIDRTQPHDPERMDELERHEGQHGEHRHDRGREPRLRLEDKQIERRRVPQRREAAEIVVPGLHVTVGEIDGAGDHDDYAGRQRERFRQQPTRRNRIGRDEHIGHEVHDQIEHVAGPSGQHLGNVELARERAVDTVDEQRSAEADEHDRPFTAHGRDQGREPERGAGGGEDMDRECAGTGERRRQGQAPRQWSNIVSGMAFSE